MIPSTKTSGTIQSATVTPVELGGVLAPNRLAPSVPGMNPNIRVANGAKTNSEKQPVMSKSWQRWMVSIIDMTKQATYATISATIPAAGLNPTRAIAGTDRKSVV